MIRWFSSMVMIASIDDRMMPSSRASSSRVGTGSGAFAAFVTLAPERHEGRARSEQEGGGHASHAGYAGRRPAPCCDAVLRRVADMGSPGKGEKRAAEVVRIIPCRCERDLRGVPPGRMN